MVTLYPLTGQRDMVKWPSILETSRLLPFAKPVGPQAPQVLPNIQDPQPPAYPPPAVGYFADRWFVLRILPAGECRRQLPDFGLDFNQIEPSGQPPLVQVIQVK